MSRIADSFKKEKVFAVYLTADKSRNGYLIQVVNELLDAGVNLIEIGVPFSDPIADGPVIQTAMQNSLQKGTTLHDALLLGHEIRKISDVPLILFSYLNPLLTKGNSLFREIKKFGFDGVLIVDLPFEESNAITSDILRAQLDPIFILTPSTSNERAKMIVKAAQGLIYYVCQKGTTGIREALPKDFENNILKIKNLTTLPLLAGFGISNFESAKGALDYADGFVVGSAIVKMIEENKSPDDIRSFAQMIDPRRVKHGIHNF